MQQKIIIKQYRENQGLSQNKLAKKARISQSYLSALEREEKSPTTRVLFRIANELNICPRLLIKCTINCTECCRESKCICGGNKE